MCRLEPPSQCLVDFCSHFGLRFWRFRSRVAVGCVPVAVPVAVGCVPVVVPVVDVPVVTVVVVVDVPVLGVVVEAGG